MSYRCTKHGWFDDHGACPQCKNSDPCDYWFGIRNERDALRARVKELEEEMEWARKEIGAWKSVAGGALKTEYENLRLRKAIQPFDDGSACNCGDCKSCDGIKKVMSGP